MEIEEKIKSIYIHIPFCNKICSYCDFCKVYYIKKWVNDYLDSLEKEIDLRYKNELIDTIYIGGGTPSSLDIDELEKLFNIISKINFNYKEFTIECNLDSLTKEKIDLFKKYKINRISIGIESFNEDNLKFLNRNLSNLELIDYIKKVGINNINLDLIYAIPNEKLEVLENDLDNLLKLKPTHISTYSLMIEPHTIIYNNKIKPIDEELDYKMYNLIIEKLKDYNHYEVSNFSLNGYESIHNLTYWNNLNYYGFGVGASGYIKSIRYTNTKSITEYINNFKEIEHDILTLRETMENEMILGLRKLKGVNLIEFRKKYNKDILEVFNIEELIKEGKLLIEDDYIKINPKYIYISNEILINFIGE